MADLKRKGKRKADEMEIDGENGEIEIQTKITKKKNKQRVLLLSSRGVTHRMRHLLNDLEALLPHVKKGMKAAIFFQSRIDFDAQIRSLTPSPSYTFSQNLRT
jgi:cephalosporin hydroxylase